MSIVRFNIRVYILLLDESKTSVLVSDEIIGGKYFTKFPGGGLEYGEGILDCLHREAMEELGQEVEVARHFYTTEFFQLSQFNPGDQIVSIYYECCLPKNSAGRRLPSFRVSNSKFEFVEMKEREESFRWVAFKNLKREEMSFPIDQEVVSRFKQEAWAHSNHSTA
jgi:8-oxo-dGTP diphosphatase